MRRAASESAAAPVSHYAAGPVELDDVCRTKLKLPYQTDSDAALLPNLIHQLGSAHEWSGVWIRPCGKSVTFQPLFVTTALEFYINSTLALVSRTLENHVDFLVKAILRIAWQTSIRLI